MHGRLVARAPFALAVLLVLFAGYGLWTGASLGVTLAATFVLGAGVLFTAYGVFGILDPQTVARFSEQLDAIGSKTPLSSVEPRAWKVSLTKVQAIAYLIVGMTHFGIVLLFLVMTP